MKIRFMQMVDYWFGIPLCFLVSLFIKAKNIFSSPITKNSPDKILFIELSEMGSAIIAYSALYRAIELFPNAKLYFLIFEKNSPSVEILELIPPENIIQIDDSSFIKFSISTFKALLRMRRIGIDTAIDMELFSRCTALLSFFSGASRRVGFDAYTNEGLYRGGILTHRVWYNSHQHMSLNFLSLVYVLKADLGKPPLVKADLRPQLVSLPQFNGKPDENKIIDEMLAAHGAISGTDKLVLINPDPGLLPLRGWPMENFKVLLKQLHQRYPQVIFGVIGLSRSKYHARTLLEDIPQTKGLDLTGQTKNLRQLLILFNRAVLLITNDSGSAHFASLSLLYSIVLFGPETPLLYAPLGERSKSIHAGLACSPCYAAANHRRTICFDNQCMQAIPVNIVFSESCKILDRIS